MAIRSALVTEREVVLYSGAGIVPRSDAEAEWRETAVKLTPFVRLLWNVDADEAFQLAAGSLEHGSPLSIE